MSPMPHGVYAPADEPAPPAKPPPGVYEPAPTQEVQATDNADLDYLQQVAARGKVPAYQIRNFQPQFASPLAAFARDLENTGLKLNFTSAGGRHNVNSPHDIGAAVDGWVSDAEGNDHYWPSGAPGRNAAGVARVQELATKNGLNLLDEYEKPSRGAWGGPHLHFSSAGGKKPRGGGPAVQMASGRTRSLQQLEDTMNYVAKSAGIDRPDIFRKLLQQESNYRRGWNDPKGLREVTSSAGAIGIGQMMPGTIQEVLPQLGSNPQTGKPYSMQDYLSNENLQIRASALYFKQQLDKYGNYPQALAAYNAGPGAADDMKVRGRITNNETRQYVRNVLGLRTEADADRAFATQSIPYDPAKASVVEYQSLPQNAARIMVEKPLAAFRMAFTADDPNFAAQHGKHLANQVLFGIPSLFGVHESKDYTEWRRSQLDLGWDDLSHPKSFLGKFFVGGVDFSLSLPAAVLVSEFAIPAAAARVGGAFASLSRATGLTGLGSTMANALIQGRTTGRLARPLADFTTAMLEQGGPPLLQQAMKNAAAGYLWGFENGMGEAINDGKDLWQAIPEATAAGVHGGAWGLALSVILPWAAGGILGAMKAGAKGVQDLTDSAMAGKFGERGGEILEKLQQTWQNAPIPGKQRLVQAFSDVYRKMDRVGQFWWQQFHLDAYNTVQNANLTSALTHAQRQSSVLLNRTATSNDAFVGAITRQIAEVNQQAAGLTTQITAFQATMQALRQQHPEVNMYVGVLGQEQRHIQVIEGLQNRLQQTMQQNNPQMVAQLGQLLNREQTVLGRVQQQITTFRQGPSATFIAAYDGAYAGAERIQPQLTQIQQSPVYQNQQNLISQTELLNGVTQIHRNIADQLDQAVQNQSGALLDRTRILNHNPSPLAGLGPTQQTELMQYTDAFLSRFRMLQRGGRLLPHEEQEMANIARTTVEGARDPAAQLAGIQDAVHRLESWIGQNSRIRGTAGRASLAQAITDRTALERFMVDIERTPGAATTRGSGVPGIAGMPDMIRDFQGRWAQHIGAGTATPETFMASARDAGIPLLAFARGRTVRDLYHNPAAIQATSQAIRDAASLLGTEGFLPSARNLRQVIEQQSLMGTLTDPNAITRATDFEARLSTAFESRSAWDLMLRHLGRNPSNWHEVFGASGDLWDKERGFHEATKQLSTHIGDQLGESMRKVLEIKSYQKISADDPRYGEKVFGFINAIEGVPGALEKLFRSHGAEAGDALGLHFSFLTALEKYRILARPESKALFRENYLQHIYPRIAAYNRQMGRWTSDDLAQMSARLGPERARSIDSLLAAGARSAQAGLYLNSVKVTERQFFDAVDDDARAALIQANIPGKFTRQDATRLKWDLLLGEQITDPSELAKIHTHSILKADGVRHVLSQFRQIDGPEGRPLLMRIPGKESDRKEFASAWNQPSGGVGHPEKVVWQKLSDIPGFSHYDLDGVEAKQWQLHPAAADHLNKYMTYTGWPTGWANNLQKDWNFLRQIQLMGSPLIHMFTIMSNMWVEQNFNMARALGVIPMGRFVRDNNPELILRGGLAGLNMATIQRATGEIAEDLIRNTQKAAGDPVYQYLWGEVPRQPGALASILQTSKDTISQRAPLHRLANVAPAVDIFLNNITLFETLQNAQIGAWLVKTSDIWQREGPRLITQYGYEAGLAQAQRSAATHINKMAGVLPMHWMSNTSRKALYVFGLAPNFLASKMNIVAGALDQVTQSLGMRSAFASQRDPGLAKMEREQLQRFILASTISSFVGANVMSFLINGHGTMENPDKFKLQPMIAEDPDGQVYGTFPLNGAVRPLMRIGKGIQQGDLRQITNAVSGQSHGVFQAIGELMGMTDRYGDPMMPDNLANPESARALLEYFWYRIMPTSQVPMTPTKDSNLPWGFKLAATKDYPAPGTEVSMRDMILNNLGVYPTTPTPMEIILAKQLDRHVRWQERKMQKVIDVGLREWVRLGVSTPEADAKLTDTIDFALNRGIPNTNPEVREAYKRVHPEGNYVLTSGEGLKRKVESMIDPTGRATNAVPRLLQPLLLEKIREAEQKRMEGLARIHKKP